MMNKLTDDEIRIEYQRLISTGLMGLFLSKTYKGNSKNHNFYTIYLAKWLERVLKQKSFDKSLAGNIKAMIDLYNVKKSKADLYGIFIQHYRENRAIRLTQQIFELSDVKRVEQVNTKLTELSWGVGFPLEYDPQANGPYEPTSEKEVFSLMKDWKEVFDESGKLIKPLRVYATEVLQEVVDACYECGFFVRLGSNNQTDDRFDEPGWLYSIDIYPYNSPINGMQIPTVYLKD